MLIDRIAGDFKLWFNRVLWLILIIFTIFGIINGYQSLSNILGIILGLILGLLVGYGTIVILGGLIAIFLRIDENIKNLVIANGGEPAGGEDASVDTVGTDEKKT